MQPLLRGLRLHRHVLGQLVAAVVGYAAVVGGVVRHVAVGTATWMGAAVSVGCVCALCMARRPFVWRRYKVLDKGQPLVLVDEDRCV